MTPAGRAKRVLFELGLELPGRRLTRFAERLLSDSEAHPGVPPDDLVQRAIERIEDRPVALVAEEPELRDQRLPRPVSSVSDGAVMILQALGRKLLGAYRAS